MIKAPEMSICSQCSKSDSLAVLTDSGWVLSAYNSWPYKLMKCINCEKKRVVDKMTCERCEDIPDETIDGWYKAKRIAELKAQLAELEGPKPNYQYIFTSSNSTGTCSGFPSTRIEEDECGSWKGKYPYCCHTHLEAYTNTAG